MSENVDKMEITRNGIEIAVIGMSGRFPGARNIDEYWNNLKNGVESISFFSEEELLEAGISQELLKNPNYVKAKAIIDDVEYFDSFFFGYTPREAEVMDPQIRIFHECVWEALEDAAYNPATFNGRIGLYAGAGFSFHWEALVLLSDLGSGIDTLTRTILTNKDYLSARISYKLNLKGPVMSISTACSTSLVAIHLAVQGLLNGECEIAIAGGSNVSIPVKTGYVYEKGMINSPDGHCRVFDMKAQGTISGIGTGAVVLKVLEDAEQDRDNIRAIIKGIAVNNDGIRKVGFQAPSIEGQAEVISAALHAAEIEPQSVSYIETHGTGTELGDPVEIEALKLAYKSRGKSASYKKNSCALGFVKANVGHLGSAAGVAGFIKTVLVLENRLIPPGVHFQTPNPKLDIENSPFYINTTPIEWKRNQYPLRAGVSSFGIGGTNVHAILEEAQPLDRDTSSSKSFNLILLSAKTPNALDQVARRLADFLTKENGTNLPDVAYTLQVGRRRFGYRRKLIASSVTDAIELLTSQNSRKVQSYAAKIEDENKKVVFMFPGLGAQYIHMGHGLYQNEPLFKEEMDRCFTILKKYTDIDIKGILFPPSIQPSKDREEAPISDFQVAQLAIFIIEYSLAKLIINWGVKPYALIGYSFGEYLSASLSGVFSLEEILKLIVIRGKLISTLPPGIMLSIPLPIDEIRDILPGDISIGIDNGSSCVVSGPADSIRAFHKQMKDRKVLCTPLESTHAIHSHVMEPVLKEFETATGKISLKAPQIPYISTVTGNWIDVSDAQSPTYWGKQMRSPVLFIQGLKKLAAEPGIVFIEIGPGRDLTALVNRELNNESQLVPVVNLMRTRNLQKDISDDYFLLDKIGLMWLYGITPDWNTYYKEEERARLSLPTYPFERQYFRIPKNPFSKGSDLLKKESISSQLADIKSKIEPSIEVKYNRPGLSTDYVPPNPDDEIESILVQSWQNIFGIREIGVHDDFFEIGGDSLKAMNMMAAIHKKFEVEILLTDFFKQPTIKSLRNLISVARKSTFIEINPAEMKEYYPLSSGQKRQYVLQQMEKNSVAYNTTIALSLEGTINREKLENAFNALVQRHESFRTSFEMVDGEPVQKIHPHIPFSIYYSQVEQQEAESIIKEFVRPFDLAKPPLMRVGLVALDASHAFLIIDSHHIIIDGTSLGVLTREFVASYEGKELPPLRLQYKDYAVWDHTRRRGQEFEKVENFWLSQFEGDIPVLNLPTDFSRPSIRSSEGRTLHFIIEKENTQALKALAHEHGATIYMVLLSILNVFLSRLSNQDDIVIGAPTAGRQHADLERIIGMFVNTLALRNAPSPNKKFHQFLTEVKEKTLAAFENQDYQHEELVGKVVYNRDASRNPLFDVMFILQNVTSRVEGQLDFKLRSYEKEKLSSQFDLSLQCFEQGEELSCSFEYCTRLFLPQTIQRFVHYFKRLVSSIVADPHQLLFQLEMIPESEKDRILSEFNNTYTDYPLDKTIHQLFEEQVSKTPDRIAVVFSSDLFPQHISYNLLNRKADRIARHLQDRGVVSNSIVALMIDRSLELPVGILGILKARGAYLPIDINLPKDRQNMILADSKVKIALCDSSQTSFDYLPEGIEIINIEDPVFNSSTSLEESQSLSRISESSPSDAVYIIYTSGSTGKPKGVVLEHRNVVNLMHYGETHTNLDFSRVLHFHSIGFDVSFQEIFHTFLTGGRLIIIPEEFRVDIPTFFKIIRDNFISTLFLPMSFLKIVFGDSDYAPAFPACVKHIQVAGEKVVIDHRLRRFLNENQVYLHNHYGPSETHVVTALTLDPNQDIPQFPTIGKPVSNTQIYILDKDKQILPIGVPGELFIGGIQVGRGYLNRPELTSEKFIAFGDQEPFYKKVPGLPKIFDKDNFTKSFKGVQGDVLQKATMLYRTGDLARWLDDGNIEFLGRMDYQVKIRGFRVELGEIEIELAKHPAVKEAVVIDRTDENSDKYLCAYIVTENKTSDANTEVSVNEWVSYLSAVLPEYMIPSYFVELPAIPVNANGKVDRKALPAPSFKGNTGSTPPRDRLEEKLSQIWKQVLGISNSLTPVGIDDNFFQSGGHSLKATILVSRIHKEMNAIVQLSDLFKTPTIRGLASVIRFNTSDQYSRIEAVEKRDLYPLSFAQKRLYILQQMSPGSLSYNMPGMIPVPDDVDLQHLKEIFHILIHRHESLRTSIEIQGEEIFQRVHDNIDFEIHIIEPTPDAENISAGIVPYLKPFDLSKAPLFRVDLIKYKNSHSILLIDMHHIITDGTSNAILREEFQSLFFGKVDELPSLRVQYKDYADWQNTPEQIQTLETQEKYWIEVFQGELPVLNLPLDFPRPSEQSFEGNTVTFYFDIEETQIVKSIVKETGATLYMVLLSLFNILLSRLSRQEDIVIGSPTAGRRHADLEKIIGMFVNTLAMRNFPLYHLSYVEFLNDLKERTLAAYENQEYPFEALVDKLSINRDIGRNPIFDVMFNLLNMEEHPGDNSDNTNNIETPSLHRKGIAKFDLTLTTVDMGKRLFFSFEYCSRLFKPQTIDRFISYFKKLVHSLSGNTHLPLSQLEIMPNEEKELIFSQFVGTCDENINYTTIDRLFEEIVAYSPDKIALVGKSSHTSFNFPKGEESHIQITYGELNRNANKIASLLQSKGVNRGSVVALMCPRNIEMIIAIMGIIKAGAAYMPIELDYPTDRIRYMLKDSQTRILLYSGDFQSEFLESIVDQLSIEAIDLISLNMQSQPGSDFSVERIDSSDLAYIIYTSGSTGKPKGVLNTHGNVIRSIRNTNYIEFLPQDNVLQVSNYAFDGSIFDIFGALLNGSRLVMIDKNDLAVPEQFSSVVLRENISLFFVTTALFNILISIESQFLKRLRKIIIGGEKASFEHSLKALQFLGRGKLLNCYGPTETTIFASYFPIDSLENTPGFVPIGKPLTQTYIYILDNELKPVPIGVMGEIYIGGPGVARGYLNKPELTAERFISVPPELDRLTQFFQNKEFLVSEMGWPLDSSNTIYKSGDLARWMPDGNIEFFGRMDHQVKIRGFRIELDEIKNALLSHENIREAEVIIHEKDEGNLMIFAYIVTDIQIQESSLRDYLKNQLPDYMIPSFFIQLDNIPLTSNGKVDKKALPAPYMEAPALSDTPRDNVEMKLAKLWADILHINENQIGINSNFFEIGGHSLKANIALSRINKEFETQFPLKEFFLKPTIREMAQYISSTVYTRYDSILPQEKKSYYELSSAQKRIYILQQMNLKNTSYNMPSAFSIKGALDRNKFEESIQALIIRHEPLRTSFEQIGPDDEPMQKIEQQVHFQIRYEQIQDEALIKQNVVHFIQPFDLSLAPLLRVALFQVSDENYIVVFDIHHIVSDGSSIEILISDFARLYEGKTLTPLSIQYKDYAAWQNHSIKYEKLKNQENYWLKKLENLSFTRLPITNFQSSRQTEGKQIQLLLDPELIKKIETFCNSLNITKFVFFISTFQIALSREVDSNDLVVGIPVSIRSHFDLKPLLGMFLNVVLIRNIIHEDDSFLNFISCSKETVLEALDNQDYPFEMLDYKLREKGYPDDQELFSILFNYFPQDTEKGIFTADLEIRPYSTGEVSPKYDLTVYVLENKLGILLNFVYKSNLYKEFSMQNLLDKFIHVIHSVLDNNEISISRIDDSPISDTDDFDAQFEKYYEGE